MKTTIHHRRPASLAWRCLLGSGHAPAFRRIRLHCTCLLWGGHLAWHLKGIGRELRHLIS